MLQVQQQTCMQDADEQSHQRVVKSSELSLRYRSPERTKQTLALQKTSAFFILLASRWVLHLQRKGETRGVHQYN